MRTGFITARVVVALGVSAAIVAQLLASLHYTGPHGRARALPLVVNFFSYFTIDSNLLTVVVLLLGALSLARRRRYGPEARGLTIFRVAVTSYMIITGVVYNALLRGALIQGATVTWSNEVLHVVGPVYLVLDWFLAPGRHRLSARAAVPALIFPAIWVAYTLIRGPFAANPYIATSTSWYPYPFINPVTSSGGYASVAAYIVGIGVVAVLLALGLARTTRISATGRWA